MKTGIYRIHNTITGDKYVGSAVNIPRRWRAHKLALRKGVHHSRFLQRSWNKYGAAAFVFTVVGYCTPEERLRFEQRAIDTVCHAYNLAKDAQSPMRGRHHTPEARAKIGAATRGRLPAITGKHHTAESRAKMSAARLGKPFTATHRANMSAAMRGKRRTKAACARIARAKAVLSSDQVRGIRACVMAGWSQGDVAQLLGVQRHVISDIHNRKHYAWVA